MRGFQEVPLKLINNIYNNLYYLILFSYLFLCNNIFCVLHGVSHCRVVVFLYQMYSTCDTNKLVGSATITTTQQPQHQPPQVNNDEGGQQQVRGVRPRHILVVCVSSPRYAFF